MKPGKITAALCAGLVLVLGCSPASVERSYVAQAIDSLHHYSLHQARLDKDSLLRAALEDLTDTSTRAHSHAILRELVRSIDRHSDLFSPGQVRGELEPLTKNTDLYPFQHRLHQIERSAVGIHAKKHPARIGIIMWRALTGQIR